MAWFIGVRVVLLAAFLQVPMPASAFNVDVESAVPLRGRPGSMFGFSVAEHRERGTSWVLVGAPEAQTGQPGVKRGGAVFRCGIDGATHCEEVPFDRKGASNDSQGQQHDEKSNQWFGATLQSSGEDGLVVACAPRYVFFSRNFNRKDPVGTCWAARDGFTNISEYSPCRTKHWGYHRQGSCQAGLGAAISRDGNRLFIGAPGSWYWQGQVYSQSTHERNVVVQSSEGPAADDDSYLGYSVVTGDLDGNGETDVAVGMPRGAGLIGKVVLYNWNLTNLQNITGEQLGAYFAYALCTVDVDGDSLDDLVVGAPLFTHYGNNDGKYETGRVYVIYQGKEPKFQTTSVLDGKNSKGRFGLALTSLGDVNKDGFGDFAVGAPYDGPNERGAVYIFHGAATGVREKASQVIFAEDVGFQLSTFGFSLSGGLDLDQNEYPDLAVGAYEADTAVFMRSRPVVKMTGSVTFRLDSKQISLDERNCTLRDGTRVSCVALDAYLEYTGVGVDDSLDLEVQFVLDTRKPKSPRMYFLSEPGRSVVNQTVHLDKNTKLKKENMYIYIKPNIRDKLTPLEAEMRYSLRPYHRARTLTPILDEDAPAVHRDSISIQKNCGKDNVCIPDLRLIATPSVNKYLLGSKDSMELDVMVKNEGEDAFEAIFELQVPPGMNYRKIERVDKAEREIPVQCSPPGPNNNNTLRCDIGNPLPKEKHVQFKVLLEPFHREGMKARYEFEMSVNSTNPENKSSISDNIKTLHIPIWVETDLILDGSSHPSELYYNTTQYRMGNLTEDMLETDIGPQVFHVYRIGNKGPSDIREAEAYFLWPAYTVTGEHLLYLLEQPETSGPVKCEYVEEANPLKIQLERRSKSFLESIGAGVGIMGGAEGWSGKRIGGGFQGLTEEERRRLEEEGREEAAFETSSSSSQRHGGSFRQETHYESGRRTGISSAGQGAAVAAGVGAAAGAGAGAGAGMIANSAGGHARGGSRQRGRGGSRVETSYEGGVSQAGYERGSAQGGYRGTTSHHTEQGGSTYSAGVAGASGSRRVEAGYERGAGARSGGEYAANAANAAGAAAGRRTYSSEREQSRNSSWSSEDGGRPRVHSSSSWRTNEDGVIRSGSSSTSGYGDLITDERDRANAAGRYAGGARVHEASESSERNYTSSATSSSNSGIVSSVANMRPHAGSQSVANMRPRGSTGSAAAGTEVNASHFAWNGASASSHDVSAGAADIIRGTHGSAITTVLDLGVDSGSQGGATVEGAGHRQAHRQGHRQGSVTVSGARQYEEEYAGEGHGEAGGSAAAAGASGSRQYGFERSGAALAGSRQYGSEYERSGAAAAAAGSRQYGAEYERSGAASGSRQYGAEYDRTATASSSSASHQRGSSSHYSGGYEWSSSSRHGDGERTPDPDLGARREGSRFYASSSNYQHSAGAGAGVDAGEGNGLADPRTTNVQSRFKLYPRIRRDADDDYDDGDDDESSKDDDLETSLQCKPVTCVRLKCVVGPLQRDQEAYVALRSRLVVGTVKKISSTEELKLSSLLSSRITRLPHIGEPDYVAVRTHEVFTQVIPTDTAIKPDIVPLWVVVLSACAGTLILLLLIFLLYKCGFFKRNRPSSAPEKEPLNRNGHYQSGDEAL